MAVEAPDEMIAIPVKEFASGSYTPVDLYIRLGENKYIIIAKEDTKTQILSLQAYQEKKIDFVYIRRGDYKKYVGASLIISDVVLSRNELAAAKKADFITKSAASVMKEIDVLGMSPEAFEHAKLVSTATVTLIEAKPDFFNLLNALSQISDSLLAHSVAVSFISTMMAKYMGWTKRGTFEKLALGGLLHDIGMKELPPDLVFKARKDMTFDEVVLYESHPFRGMEVLRSIPSVPDDVAAIVFEHHENAIGLGFPRKLRDMRLNPLSRVVALANVFVELTLKGHTNPAPKSATEAIGFMTNVMGQPFNKEAFGALSVMVNQGQSVPSAKEG